MREFEGEGLDRRGTVQMRSVEARYCASEGTVLLRDCAGERL